MAVKSAYREKTPAAETPAPNIPEEPPQPSESVNVEFTNGAKPAPLLLDTKIMEQDPSKAELLPADGPVPDEATLALQKQLADLKKSEELVRQHAMHQHAAQMAQQQQQPPTREQKLAMWAQQGMSPENQQFLAANPAMVDMHDVTRAAASEAAQQGHEPNSEAYRQATKTLFDQHLASLQAPQAQPAPTPEFFRPPPEPARSPAAPDRAALYAAAPSRREVGSREPQHPRQVKLSPIEQEIARNLGLSDVAYAEGKLRLAREKQSGERQS